jgi:hypothetical protein
MTKTLILAVSFLLTGIVADAQTPARPLKKIMELKMPKTVDDDMPGTRGAGVAWHPVLKKYYAAFAGNVGYPLAVFDEKGKRLSEEDLTTMSDIRGLWYNPTTKKISGNGYNEFGWFSYTLEKTGIPSDIEIEKEGMNQPSDQAVGVYNATAKQVLFLKGAQVYTYNKDAELLDSIAIHFGRTKKDGPADDEDIFSSPEDYNYTSLIYTGLKGQELGFLNTTNTEIELYDIKTGFLVKRLTLPDTATPEASFNFTYANGIFWLFNIEMRKWVGYK